MSANHPAYNAALAADEAFEAELVRIYGKANAANHRYLAPWIDLTPEQSKPLIAAHQAKYDADSAWLKVMRAGRS